MTRPGDHKTSASRLHTVTTVTWLGIHLLFGIPNSCRVLSPAAEVLRYGSARVFRKPRESPNETINNSPIPHRTVAQLAGCPATRVSYTHSLLPFQSDIHRTHGTTSALSRSVAIVCHSGRFSPCGQIRPWACVMRSLVSVALAHILVVFTRACLPRLKGASTGQLVRDFICTPCCVNRSGAGIAVLQTTATGVRSQAEPRTQRTPRAGARGIVTHLVSVTPVHILVVSMKAACQG